MFQPLKLSCKIKKFFAIKEIINQLGIDPRFLFEFEGVSSNCKQDLNRKMCKILY